MCSSSFKPSYMKASALLTKVSTYVFQKGSSFIDAMMSYVYPIKSHPRNFYDYHFFTLLCTDTNPRLLLLQPYTNTESSLPITSTTMSTTQLISIAAGFIAVFALAIYLFGVPPETKRKMERTALNTMGENKVSYMAKGMFR
jgi:hypothetical protein